MNIKSMAGLLLLFLAQSSFAADGKTVLLLQRSMPHGVEQTGVVFDLKSELTQVTMTTNSNFLFSAEKSAKLGFFKAHRDKLLDYLRALTVESKPNPLSFQLPASRQAGPEIYSSPHRLRILIDGRELDSASERFQTLLSLTRIVLKESEWKAVDAVSVGAAETSYLECDHSQSHGCALPSVQCHATAEHEELCKVGNFGWAHLED